MFNHKFSTPSVIVIAISIIALGMVGVAWYYDAHGGTIEGKGVVVSNFKECADAGYPVMETYPRRCQAKDYTYTEVITNSNVNTNLNSNVNVNTNSATNGNTNTTVDTTGWKTYTNEKYGINLKYPDDWTRDLHDDANEPVYYQSIIFDISKSYHNSVGETDKGGMVLRAYPSNTLGSLEEWINKNDPINDAMTKHSQVETTIADNPAIYRVVTSNVAGGYLNSYYIELDDAVVEIEVNSRILTADKQNQDDFDNLTRNILSILTFTK